MEGLAGVLIYSVSDIDPDTCSEDRYRKKERREGVLHPNGCKSQSGETDPQNRQQGIADYRLPAPQYEVHEKYVPAAANHHEEDQPDVRNHFHTVL